MNYLQIYEEILALTDSEKAAAEAVAIAFEFEEKRKADEEAREMIVEEGES
jgi:hypothetical protein